MIGSHGSPSPRAACHRGCTVSCGDPATRPGHATQRARSPPDDARTIARAAGSDRHEHAAADAGTGETSRSTRSSGGHRAVARIHDCRAANAQGQSGEASAVGKAPTRRGPAGSRASNGTATAGERAGHCPGRTRETRRRTGGARNVVGDWRARSERRADDRRRPNEHTAGDRSAAHSDRGHGD